MDVDSNRERRLVISIEVRDVPLGSGAILWWAAEDRVVSLPRDADPVEAVRAAIDAAAASVKAPR